MRNESWLGNGSDFSTFSFLTCLSSLKRELRSDEDGEDGTGGLEENDLVRREITTGLFSFRTSWNVLGGDVSYPPSRKGWRNSNMGCCLDDVAAKMLGQK